MVTYTIGCSRCFAPVGTIQFEQEPSTAELGRLTDAVCPPCSMSERASAEKEERKQRRALRKAMTKEAQEAARAAILAAGANGAVDEEKMKKRFVRVKGGQ